jgi:hypothetical protein
LRQRFISGAHDLAEPPDNFRELLLFCALVIVSGSLLENVVIPLTCQLPRKAFA